MTLGVVCLSTIVSLCLESRGFDSGGKQKHLSEDLRHLSASQISSLDDKHLPHLHEGDVGLLGIYLWLERKTCFVTDFQS